MTESETFGCQFQAATRLNHEGETIPCNWRVNDSGQHCVDWGEEERCKSIVDKGNGTYQKIEEDKPGAVFTVAEGNPVNLQSKGDSAQLNNGKYLAQTGCLAAANINNHLTTGVGPTKTFLPGLLYSLLQYR